MLNRFLWIALGGFLALLAGAPSPLVSSPSPTPTAALEWRPLRVGAGGYLTGLDISPDGKVKLVRADTYGAYAWNPSRRQWRQLVTAQSMPASDRVLHDNPGVYEIRVAPSDSARFYMAFDGFVYRSDDAGHNWRRTQFPRAAMNANDPFRTNGQKMAVDPAAPDRVLVGTAEKGLFLTDDGGRHWTEIAQPPPGAAAPEGGYPGIAGIAFDPHSAEAGGRTATVYAASYGHGVYRSQDGGATWAPLEGGPRNVTHASVARDGAYYAVGDDGAAVWRHDGSGWSDITPDERGARRKGRLGRRRRRPRSTPNRILVARADGSLAISSDRGQTCAGATAPTLRERTAGPRRARRAVAGVDRRDAYMSVGDMALDPAHPDRLWFAEGIGVWQSVRERRVRRRSFARLRVPRAPASSNSWRTRSSRRRAANRSWRPGTALCFASTTPTAIPRVMAPITRMRSSWAGRSTLRRAQPGLCRGTFQLVGRRGVRILARRRDALGRPLRPIRR